MSLFNVYPLNPIAITKAAGSRVWDDKGQEYLDMYGGHAVISIGHTQPHWVKRIEDQLHAIAFYSNSVVMPIQEELATALNNISEKKDFQLFLCNSGAEANENALKLASFHTGRKKIVSFKKGFLGRLSKWLQNNTRSTNKIYLLMNYRSESSKLNINGYCNSCI